MNYLTNRNQRTKVENVYSSLKPITDGVPQGSILGPLLFNIYLADLFIIIPDMEFASYADDNTPYSSGNSIEEVITSLEAKSNNLFEWFGNNYMKANSSKCHLLLSICNNTEARISESTISNSKSEKLLGVTIDHPLSFEEHINNLCKKASQKLNALASSKIYVT